MDKYELKLFLEKNCDQDYQKFNKKLIPGPYNILGVRTKTLKEIAKSEKNNFALLNDFSFYYHEEIEIFAFILAYSSMEKEKRLDYIKIFLKHNNNWATNDSAAFSFNFIKKDLSFYWPFLVKQLASKNNYSKRFAITCFMKYYLNEQYFFTVKTKLCQLKSDDYYVNMAMAWYFQNAYLVFPEEVKKLFLEKSLSKFVNNKAIQKIRESRRVSLLEKTALNKLKY